MTTTDVKPFTCLEKAILNAEGPQKSVIYAFRFTCRNCGKNNHYESLCRGKPKQQQSEECEGAIFESLCAVSEQSSVESKKRLATLDDHTYNQMSDTWIKQ